MSKAKSGMMLVAGLLTAACGGALSSHANTAHSTPDTDWIYNAANGGGVAVILAGLSMFFIGSLHFARGVK